MRGTKAKRLRRQAYGAGMAMPRKHDYMNICNGQAFNFSGEVPSMRDRIKQVVSRVIDGVQGKAAPRRFYCFHGGTLVIQSARRMYQLLKRGPVAMMEVQA